MVIRKLDPNATTTLPQDARKYAQPIAAWIMESDRYRTIENLDQDVDVQVDVSPSLTTSTSLIDGGAGDVSTEQ